MKVSIITTTYNSEATVEMTIQSVLRQTYADIEYLIVDGASKDGTLDIVRKYESLFQGRMRWVSEKDRGLYDALNTGIASSTGDIVGILNSDDFFTSNDVIQRMVNDFSDDVDAVYGDIHFVSPGNLNKSVRYYSSRFFRPWQLRFGYMPAHPSFYARRYVFDKVGLYSLDYKIAADYDMMVRIFFVHNIKTKYIPMDFVTMRVGGLSTKNFQNRIKITLEDVKACKSNGLYSNVFLCSCKYFTKLFEFCKVLYCKYI